MSFNYSDTCYCQTREGADGENDQESDSDGGDIEAQIRKEVEGLKPGSEKPRQFHAIKMDIPCGMSTLCHFLESGPVLTFGSDICATRQIHRSGAASPPALRRSESQS